MVSCSIVDVGHGNCAVATDGKRTIVVDAGLGNTLVDFSLHRGITSVDAVFVSHADDDHIGGLQQLLLHQAITVRHLYLNPDHRQTRAFVQLRRSIETARLEKRTLRVHPSLTTTDSQKLGDIGIGVLSPLPENALSTVHGRDLKGLRLSPHAMSAVLMITNSDRPVALLPGDLDEHGLDLLLKSQEAKTAPLLVFPHHGGLAESRNLGRFAEQLYTAVRPHYVVFSTGRFRHGTPRAEIVAAIRRIAGENVHFACTELSEWCAQKLPRFQPSHLTPDPAHGKSERYCCAGTMTITVGEDELFVPDRLQHSEFKRMYARSGLCRNRI